MKAKNIKILLILSLFLCLIINIVPVTATVSDTTEFLPDPQDSSFMVSQQMENVRVFEQALSGMMSQQALYAITRPSQTSPISVDNTKFIFTKNLKLGDNNSDVLALQKSLNAGEDTLVSASGAGSPGNETTYFGQKTRLAVIKYQNKYAKEVLIPNGLTSGTGYFGISTRTFINSSQKPTTVVATNSNVRQPAKIISLEPTHGKDGTQVTIHGSGITRTANKIIAGGNVMINAKSTDGKTLAFTMRGSGSIDTKDLSVASSTYINEHFLEFATSTFPSLMKYPVCFLNDNGLSNCAFFTVDL
jgi:hypothetical protein